MAIKKLGILVGGGPAPGINGAIAAAALKRSNTAARRSDFMTGWNG